ncbi:hypothetical protein ACJX0J_026813, partial [Zea mays]
PEQLIVTEIAVPPVSIWPSVVVPPELAHAMHGRSGRKARPKSALPPPRLSIPPSSNPPIPAPFNRSISPNRHRSMDTEKGFHRRHDLFDNMSSWTPHQTPSFSTLHNNCQVAREESKHNNHKKSITEMARCGPKTHLNTTMFCLLFLNP